MKLGTFEKRNTIKLGYRGRGVDKICFNCPGEPHLKAAILAGA